MLNILEGAFPNGAPFVSSRLCVDCGEPISSKRLQALPHTNHCLICKAKNDLTVMREESSGNPYKLGRISNPNTDDVAPSGRRIKKLSTGGLVSIMASAEEEPGQARNTGLRVISTEGRARMSELNGR